MPNAPLTSCRCEILHALFKSTLPCGPCERSKLISAYADRGYVEAAASHLQAYRDCGIEPKSVPGLRKIWVPSWAHLIVTELFNTVECGPILARAAEDEFFRSAIESLIRLGTMREALRTFASEHGVKFADE